MAAWKTLFACVIAGLLSGCVNAPIVDGKPYYGTGFKEYARMRAAGFMPRSISCRMPRSGPAANTPNAAQVRTEWVKDHSRPLRGWSILISEPARLQERRAQAWALGNKRKISAGSFYQTVAHQRFTCEVWRAQ